MDETISNLTSASGCEVTGSSGSRTETPAGAIFQQQQSFNSPANQAPHPPSSQKKKRSLPGNPDPDAEVIALSPKSLLATNRFMCEICGKGFQRDQNLQLHRRGHNLPWKLKQRANKEVVRKKVYVCPEATCVHHDPSRALGDLTGIKKHFCRKHGEKKWKCDKCSKRYAVQSDWKAHSKICGTREYKCDCGTIFSRRDSFITHRAFCDALAAEESARSATTGVVNPLFSSSHQLNISLPSTIKREQETNLHHLLSSRLPPPLPLVNTNDSSNTIPPWLGEASTGPGPPQQPFQASSTSSTFDPFLHPQEQQQPQNPNPSGSLLLPPFHPTPASSPHMSATALLQKAAQMGVAMGKPSPSSVPSLSSPVTSSANNILRERQGPHHQAHMFSEQAIIGNASRDQDQFVTNIKITTAMDQMAAGSSNSPSAGGGLLISSSNSLVHDMVSLVGFDGSSSAISFYDHENVHRILNPKRPSSSVYQEGGNADDGLTRDFLGLKAFSHNDFFNIAGFDDRIGSSSDNYGKQKPNNTSWQG